MPNKLTVQVKWLTAGKRFEARVIQEGQQGADLMAGRRCTDLEKVKQRAIERISKDLKNPHIQIVWVWVNAQGERCKLEDVRK